MYLSRVTASIQQFQWNDDLFSHRTFHLNIFFCRSHVLLYNSDQQNQEKDHMPTTCVTARFCSLAENILCAVGSRSGLVFFHEPRLHMLLCGITYPCYLTLQRNSRVENLVQRQKREIFPKSNSDPCQVQSITAIPLFLPCTSDSM